MNSQQTLNSRNATEVFSYKLKTLNPAIKREGNPSSFAKDEQNLLMVHLEDGSDIKTSMRGGEHAQGGGHSRNRGDPRR
jgi:hypothetical protein